MAAAAWATGQPPSIRSHSSNRPCGVRRAFFGASVASSVSVFLDSYTLALEASSMGGPCQQGLWALHLDANLRGIWRGADPAGGSHGSAGSTRSAFSGFRVFGWRFTAWVGHGDSPRAQRDTGSAPSEMMPWSL